MTLTATLRKTRLSTLVNIIGQPIRLAKAAEGGFVHVDSGHKIPDLYRIAGRTPEGKLSVYGLGSKHEIDPSEVQKVVAPHTIRKMDFNALQAGEGYDPNAHKKIVEEAIAAKKKVPLKVLAEHGLSPKTIFDVPHDLPSLPGASGAEPPKIPIDVGVYRGREDETPNMWITDMAGLHHLVNHADRDIVDRLHYAIAKRQGEEPKVILRADRDPRTGFVPQVEVPNSTAFKSHPGIDNLYVPAGRKLRPNLRQSVIRNLMGANDNIAWLHPEANGSFTHNTIPASAMKPLSENVEYSLGEKVRQHAHWQSGNPFAFEPLREIGETPKEAPKPRQVKETPVVPVQQAGVPPAPVTVPPARTRRRPATIPEGPREDPQKPVRDRLGVLEKQYLETKAPSLWPQIADLNTRLGRDQDAGLAHSHYLWDRPDSPAEAHEWLKSQDARAENAPTAAAFDRLNPEPTSKDMRALAARVKWYSQTPEGQKILQAEAPEIGSYLQGHENLLDSRSAWLAHQSLAKVNHDVLGMARVRGRFLDQLRDKGISRERDLPSFMRHAGDDAARRRDVAEHAEAIHDLARKWGSEHKVNDPYFKKLFAWGQANLGNREKARQLQAESQIHGNDPVHRILGKAFDYRINQAASGDKNAGPLPPEIQREIDEADREHKASADAGKGTNPSYITNRLINNSNVLSPTGKEDVMSGQMRFSDPESNELHQLRNIRDPKELEEKIDNSIAKMKSPEKALEALDVSLSLAPKVGENLVSRLLARVPATLEAASGVADDRSQQNQRKLLANALSLAAHYGQTDAANAIFRQFGKLLNSRRGNKEITEDINGVSKSALHSLRKLGMTDQIHQFLDQASKKIASLPDQKSPPALRGKLALAEGFGSVGQHEKARPLINEAKEALFSNKIADHAEYRRLAKSYIGAISQLPVNEALDGIKELFRKMRKIENGFTSKPWFSENHLGIVEEAVQSLLGENFTMNEKTRQLLMDEEYQIRKRIHGDWAKMLAGEKWEKL